MASCSKCGREVGCGCNLIEGQCMTCYNSTLSSSTPVSRATRKVVNYSTPDAQPVTGFTEILNTPTLTKQEKIRRINEILEKAQQQ